MKVYECRDYRQFLKAQIYGPDAAWGIVKRLAKTLSCHGSYISQVARGKADFSNEQAVRLAQFLSLPADETDFLVDLVARDRAGDGPTRELFQRRLTTKLMGRKDLEKRLKATQTLSSEQEAWYYASWIPQALHMVCQLDGALSPEMMAQTLRLDSEQVTAALRRLEEMGVLAIEDGTVRSRVDSIHLGRNSPHTTRSHINWRSRTVSELMAGHGGGERVHYSAAVSLSAKAAAEIHEVIIKHLEAVRGIVMPSASETVFVHCIDFYPLLAPVAKTPSVKGTVR